MSTAEGLGFERGREKMVTAQTSNGAGGAVSHPLALIPGFLPGRSLFGPPGRFYFVSNYKQLAILLPGKLLKASQTAQEQLGSHTLRTELPPHGAPAELCFVVPNEAS